MYVVLMTCTLLLMKVHNYRSINNHQVQLVVVLSPRHAIYKFDFSAAATW